MALIIGLIATGAQFIFGHHHAVQVYKTQPIKLAAFEGHFETTKNAPLLVFGIPDREARETHFKIPLPGMLSFGVSGDFETEIKGLNDYEEEHWPPLLPTFLSFHTMVALWAVMMGLMILGVVLMWKNSLQKFKPYLHAMVWAIPIPIIANTLGWIVTEVGRQPWVVYPVFKDGVIFDDSIALLTRDGVSPLVSAGEIIFSLALFSVIYALLFGVWFFLIRHKLNKGPDIQEAVSAKGEAITGKEASA